MQLKSDHALKRPKHSSVTDIVRCGNNRCLFFLPSPAELAIVPRIFMEGLGTFRTACAVIGMALIGIIALSGKSIVAGQSGNVEAGKAAYATNCRSCHGVEGQGNPNMARRLGVPIKDLRLPEVQKTTDEVWRKDIVQGVGKMDPTDAVSPQDVTNIIAFLRSIGPQVSQPSTAGPPAVTSAVPQQAAPKGDVEAGKQVYTRECRSCHGATGEGNPNMARRLGVPIRGLALPEVQKATDAEWTKDINQGIGKMDATPGVSPADVVNVIAFMRSLKKN